MENKMPCLPAHKDYLGRGIDNRTKNNNLLDQLSSGDEIISHDEMEIKVTPIATTHQEVFHEKVQSTTGGQCGMGITCANVFGEVTAKSYTGTKIKHREMLKTTKMVKIKRESIKCKKYDHDLCKFIVEYIEENQEEQIDQGKRFTNGNPKDRLEEYLLAAEKSKEGLSQMWPMVATACSRFLDKTMSTHYVSGIKLGASQQESTDSNDCGTNAAFGVGVNACQKVSCSAQGQCERGNERSVFITEEIGEIDKCSGDVIKEEVIEATLTPVSELIEHKDLRRIMQNLLHCHQHQGSEDNQYGPFKISCREILPAGEQEIYWQVINNKEICGTTREEEASTFYTKHLCTGELFEIIHKMGTKQTKMYVLAEPQQPLKLVRATENLQKISFILQDHKSTAIDVPKTMDYWKTKSPYFIQRPSTNKGYPLPNNECYLCVEKEHRDDDEQPKYTVAAAKNRETESGLMQFYFTSLDDPSVSVQRRTRIQDDSGSAAGPPPAPPSIQQQPKCGSATGTDLPNELKDFFELIGKDYIFPIQVNAEED